MTEQELRFVLSAQDEGLRKGIEAAERAVIGLDAAVLDLSKSQLSYNTAAKRFVDESGKFVGSHQALNRLGLTTTQQLHQQVRAYDELIVRYKSDVVLTRQLIQQKEALLHQFGAAGRSLKANTQLYYQAGQAISDFAVAGIRGAANNIEFLAAALGASAPLMIGISLVSAAFFTFGDDIVKALDPVGSEIDRVKGKTLELLKIIDEDRPTIALFREQIPDAISLTERRIAELEEQIRGASANAAVGLAKGLSAAFNLPQFFANKSGSLLDGALGTQEEIARLGRLKARLIDFQNSQADYQAEQDLRNDLENDAIVEKNNLRAETIRLDLELVGLGEQAKDLTNAQLLEMEKKVGFAGIIKDLTKDEVSETEKLVERNRELAGVLDGLRSGERDRIETLKAQIKELENQVTVAEKLKALRFEVGGSVTSGLALQGLQRAAISDTQAIPGLDTQELLAQLDPRLSGTKALAEAESLAAENMARIKDDARELIDLNNQLTQSIQGGLSGAFSELASSVGEAVTSTEGFQNFGAAILKSLGSFAQQFGATLISFGTAGVAIQTFVTNPIGAIIAGGALVALGGALKGTAQRQLDQFNATQKAGAGSAKAATVTALGFSAANDYTSRGASLPTSARSPRQPVVIQVEPVERYTPAGDRVRSFRAALNTDAKQGGSGKL